MSESIKTRFIKSLKNQKEFWVLVEIIYMVTFLLLWVQNILPLMNVKDAFIPKIALIIVGFAFSSFLCAIYILPKFATMVTFFLYENVKKLVMKYGSES